MNTTTQGSVGLGMAVSYFALNGYTVLLPLNDNQGYDMAVDNGSGIKRIQVKTTGFKEKDSDNFTVQLKSVRPNRKSNPIKNFDAKQSDMVFILTSDGDKYLIPSTELDGRVSLALGVRVSKWKI